MEPTVSLRKTSWQLVLLLLASLVFSACSGDSQTEQFEKSIAQLDQTGAESNKVYLIMEQHSCATCLYKADAFFKKHGSDPRITYVFASGSSEKYIKIKYDITGTEDNVIIDNESVLFKNNVQLSFPSILYFENGALVNLEVASTDNFRAYDRLEALLAGPMATVK